jgi:peptidoglycan/xylan/chitin deacetylase (PgdA/CDA1 family)
MNPITDCVLSLAWRTHVARLIGARIPIALLYHGISRITQPHTTDAENFEKHVAMLRANFDLLTPGEYFAYQPRRGRIGVLLTFDDGYANNYSVVAPILKKYGVPALFFACKRHSVRGKYLWNTHLTMLRRWFRGDGFDFLGKHVDMRGDARDESIRRVTEKLHAMRPYPQAMYDAIEAELPPLESFLSSEEIRDLCEGLSEGQIADMSRDELFSFGVHTLDHAILTHCSEEESLRQLSEGRKWLSQLTGKPCDTVAYPCGEYTAEILDQVNNLGFTHGFAVIPALRTTAELEEPRLGVYNPQISILGFKVMYGRLIRSLGLRMG